MSQPATSPRFAVIRSAPSQPATDAQRLEVGQGMLAVGGDGLELTATLGSCVGFCLHDPERRLGGMIHIFQCVDDGPVGPAAVIAELERLVNALMSHGVGRTDLVAKLCGGARTLPFGRDHGTAMSAACQDYLQSEGIPIHVAELGGRLARRVRFFPGTGLLEVSKTTDPTVGAPPPASVRGNAPDLF
ncbi:MAG: chemotaxis protein CheD [Pseudomonadota bacterium]